MIQERDRPLSILLAEDDLVWQKMALLMLKRLGHRAECVANGLEAMQALDKNSYDLVFLDIQMPIMDGIMTTKEIRKRWPTVPKIVVITACNWYREICFEAGANEFLLKPVGLDDLRAAIMRIAIPQDKNELSII
jgi:CheY-like chemotaxis protein